MDAHMDTHTWTHTWTVCVCVCVGATDEAMEDRAELRLTVPTSSPQNSLIWFSSNENLTFPKQLCESTLQGPGLRCGGLHGNWSQG